MTARCSPRRSVSQLPVIVASDPSVGPGDEVVYHEEFSLEYRIESLDSESSGSFIHFRIITRHSADRSGLEQVKFEIFNDTDLYFFIESVFDAPKFEQLKASGDLLVEFEDFPHEVTKLLHDSQMSNSDVNATLYEAQDGSRRLEFNQLLELRAVEIFKLQFDQASPEFVDNQAQYRYEKLAYELALKKRMLAGFKKYMSSRNPVLMKAIDGKGSKSPRRDFIKI
jgi:hypothetical protein